MPFFDLSQTEIREVFPGYRGKFVHSAAMTFIHWEIDANSPLPEHKHPHEQVVSVIEGSYELTIDGETSVLSPGNMAVIPSNALHSGRSLTRCRIIDVFYPIREDYR